MDTYFLTIPSAESDKADWGKYVTGPSLKSPRQSSGCGVLTNPGDGNQLVIVAAGGVITGPLDTTEMLVVRPDQGEWKDGPKLPYGIQNARGVTTSDGKSFLLVGGLTLKFDPL